MEKPVFNHLVVLGVGLIGGSLALAAKKSGLVAKVTGWSRTQKTLDQALDLGVVDVVEQDLNSALDNADCIVVSTPTQFAESLIVEVIERVPSSTVITDVASVKANLVSAILEKYTDFPENVVLAHPIAGSEKSGVTAAIHNLFEKRNTVITPLESTSEEALHQVSKLWQGVGSDIITMPPEEHDKVLALTSHLPHILSYALVGQIVAKKNSDELFQFAGGGFRDFTRIAGSDPRMWREIALANKDALLACIKSYQEQLEIIKALLNDEQGDQIEFLFEKAKKGRDSYIQLLEDLEN